MCTVTVILGSILFLLRDPKSPTNRLSSADHSPFMTSCVSCCNCKIVLHHPVSHPSAMKQGEDDPLSRSQTSYSFVSTTSNRSSTNTIIPYKEGSNVLTEGEIGTWTRGELLGSGSFGHVWLAIDHRRGRMFAVKQVRMMQLHQSNSTTEKIQQVAICDDPFSYFRVHFLMRSRIIFYFVILWFGTVGE